MNVEPILALQLAQVQLARLQATGRLERFLKSHTTILPITPHIAKEAGTLRGNLQGQGKIRSQADMFIAATARAHGLTLITRNEKDFEGCGIKVLNPFI